MHAAALCKVLTCYRSLYDRIHMSCITIRIIIATFTPVVADLPLLPSRGKFNPALGQIYPRATFTPAWCIRGMSFFKFILAIPLGFVQTSGWCIYGPWGAYYKESFYNLILFLLVLISIKKLGLILTFLMEIMK